MGVVRDQDIWRTGTRVYVEEETDGPLYDLGTINVVNPQTEIEEARLLDSDGGVRRLITKEVTNFTERYEVTLFNCSLRNLRYLFYADAVENFSQSSTTQTAALPIWPGQNVKIRNSSATMMYNIGTVVSVQNAAGTTLVVDTDYKVNLQRGFIRFVNSGTTVAAASGEAGTIVFQANSMAPEARLMYPQSKAGTFEGNIVLIWGRGNNAQQTVREGTGSIVPGVANFSDVDYSNFPVTIEMTTDPSNTDQPSGRLLQAIGPIPATINTN